MDKLTISALELTHFKNHRGTRWDFNEKVNIITGNNGNGKTNVLDALHYLSLMRSYLGGTDGQNITHGESMALIRAQVERKSSSHSLDIGLKKGQKKKIRVDGKEIERMADHVGYLPVVMISPMDRDLILDAAETRRRLVDATVSQNSRPYLNALLAYNKALAQRNTTLKYFASNRTFDQALLSLYDEILVEEGTKIYEERKRFVEELQPAVQRYYEILSGGKETVDIIYKSTLHNASFQELLDDKLDKDKVLQFTSVGTHRDDLVFSLGGHPIKRVGSQGQQKSFLIALKLAQFEIGRTHLKMAPLLLLDDIFDKLDEGRVANLLQLVNTEDFGQIFITDTNAERMLQLSDALQLQHTTFEIQDNGDIKTL